MIADDGDAAPPDTRFISVHYPFPNMVAAAFDIALESERAGVRAVILDLGAQSNAHLVNPNIAIRNLLEHVDPMSRRGSIKALCETYGVTYQSTAKWAPEYFREDAAAIVARLPNNVAGLEALREYSGLLGPSLANWLSCTVAMDSKPAQSVHARWTEFAVAQFLAIHAAVTDCVTERRGRSEVVVWNARLPKYAAPWAAALDVGASVRFYENSGFCRPRYVYERFPVFDRVLVQNAAMEEYERVASPAVDAEIREWFASRQDNVAVNPFLSPLAEPSAPRDQSPSDADARQVVIFTSSPDELVAVPGDWATGRWSGQVEAITTTARILVDKGFRVVVRIHPNIANKSWREYAEQVTAYNLPGVVVVLPTDRADSYELIRESCAVFVWASTIGLEAVAMSKPTYVLGAAAYDETADVRKLGSAEEVGALDMQGYQVHADSALPVGYQYMTECARNALSPRTWALVRAMYLRDHRFRLLFRVGAALRVARVPAEAFRRPHPLLRMGEVVLGRDRARASMSRLTRRFLIR